MPLAATAPEPDNDGNGGDENAEENGGGGGTGYASAEAERLQARARALREEADSMEQGFAERKLASLEGLLERGGGSLSEDERRYLTDKMDSLKSILDPQTATAIGGGGDNVEEKNTQDEEEQGEKKAEEEEEEVFVGELTSEERKALEELDSLFDEFKSALGDEIADFLTEGEDMKDLSEGLANAIAGNITREELDVLKEVVDFANKIPGLKRFWEQEKGNIFDDLRMQTEVFEGEDGAAAIVEILPESMRSMNALREAGRLNETDMTAFVDEAGPTLRNVFTMTSKPRNVGFGYVLEGKPRVDGDALIAALDSAASAAGGGALGKTICYYIRDGGALEKMDEIEFLDAITAEDDGTGDGPGLDSVLANGFNLAPPTLLVLPRGLAPTPVNRGAVQWATSALGLGSVLWFVGGCYSGGGGGSFADLPADPTMLAGLLGLALIHELGHVSMAALNGVTLTFPPALLPSAGGLIIPSGPQFLTPPKDNRAYFDIALGGPLLGFAASWATLVYGLRKTALPATVAQVAALPHVPLQFLQLSSLTSATLESFLGTDTLRSLDPLTEAVAVHPLVVAGHLGLLANALACLPTRDTSDGGRMARGAFSRWSAAPFLQPLAGVFLLVQACRGWDVTSLLAVYVVLGGFLEGDTDVPCRNDVDPAGGWRAVAWVAACSVAAITVSPSF